MGCIKVRVTFSRNNLLHYDIVGIEVPYEALTVGDLTERLWETERHLSRITGLEVKIETAME